MKTQFWQDCVTRLFGFTCVSKFSIFDFVLDFRWVEENSRRFVRIRPWNKQNEVAVLNQNDAKPASKEEETLKSDDIPNAE